MTRITSRTPEFDPVLVDKIDEFLEERIRAEFDELKAELLTKMGVIDALTAENMHFRDQITALSVENFKLHIDVANLS
jgi:hypothetical protein